MPKHFCFDKKYDFDYSCLLYIQLVIAIFIKIKRPMKIINMAMTLFGKVEYKPISTKALRFLVISHMMKSNSCYINDSQVIKLEFI